MKVEWSYCVDESILWTHLYVFKWCEGPVPSLSLGLWLATWPRAIVPTCWLHASVASFGSIVKVWWKQAKKFTFEQVRPSSALWNFQLDFLGCSLFHAGCHEDVLDHEDLDKSCTRRTFDKSFPSSVVCSIFCDCDQTMHFQGSIWSYTKVAKMCILGDVTHNASGPAPVMFVALINWRFKSDRARFSVKLVYPVVRLVQYRGLQDR